MTEMAVAPAEELPLVRGEYPAQGNRRRGAPPQHVLHPCRIDRKLPAPGGRHRIELTGVEQIRNRKKQLAADTCG